ncbi:MAG: hypothetical protein LBD14_05680 [Puniceicoccales bacterium]|jgi:hypothetical protein|nr:hypothetical protein [Puniceicoccales bacterium]
MKKTFAFSRFAMAVASVAACVFPLVVAASETPQIVEPASPVASVEKPDVVVGKTVPTIECVRQYVLVEEKGVSVRGYMLVRGGAGDRFNFLRSEAVLTHCLLPKGIRRVHLPEGRSTDASWAQGLVLDEAGTFIVRFDYQLSAKGGAAELRLPTPSAVNDHAEVLLVAKDCQVTSSEAASVTGRRATASGEFEALTRFRNVALDSRPVAVLRFFPSAERTIRWAPNVRDRRSEALVFYAETADLYVPSLGVLGGRHLVRIRPAQGILHDVNIVVPAGLTIANVSGDGVGRWRFDPERRRLHVPFGMGQANENTLLVETQMGIGALPQSLTLAPLVVEGSATQVGMFAVGTGDDVQVATVRPGKMLAVTNDDFAAAKLDAGNAVLRRSYRYSDPATAHLVVEAAAVAPEIRLQGVQNLSLGEDRTSLSATWNVDIKRAGVFRLAFDLPETLDIESLSGPSLSHWTESKEKGRRTVIMHLRGRTLGSQTFALSLAGPGIAGKTTWSVPRLVLHDAVRQSGQILIIPEDGLRLHVAQRTGATQYDPSVRNVETGSRSKAQFQKIPRNALAFQHPQREWSIEFKVESLAPWIQATYLHDLTLRDGQARALANFEYNIENAATKTLRVQLPADAESVHFTGPHLDSAHMLPAGQGGEAGAAAIWEIKLQRRILGKTTFQATYQRPAPAGTPYLVSPVGAIDAGLQRGWLTLRTAGRLELKPGAIPPSLTPTDWQSVPPSLRATLAEPATTLCVIENNYRLPLTTLTHDPARLLALRIERADLQTLLSENGKDGGQALTRAALTARLAGKGLLRATLPSNATYWHCYVNNEPVRVAVNGAELLIPVAPNPDTTQPTTIEFYYADGTGGGELKHRLEGPRFNVPLENITWRVHLPDGRTLGRHRGDLRLQPAAPATKKAPSFGLGEYLAGNTKAVKQKEADAQRFIQLGTKYRYQGQQEQAVQALALAGNLSQGNKSLNEDARVQLNVLRSEQIEVGMNRRKNTFYNNISSNGGSLDGLNVAIMSNGTNLNHDYNQQEISDYRSQNTTEDNEVNQRIAARMLAQQLTAASAPDSIRTLLPAQGETLTFERSLQVGTGSDLQVQLELRPVVWKAAGRFWPFAGSAVLAFLAALLLPRLVRPKAPGFAVR